MVDLKISSKRKFAIILFCLLILAIGIVGIGAYLTDADSLVNSLKIGQNTIEIIEEFDPPEEVIPGVSFPKDVKVKNTGPTDCYIRIKAVLSNSHMEQYCEIDWNKTDWIYNAEDGYYYYPDALTSGAETPSLMTTVKIKDSAAEDKIIDFNIIVYAESVEAHQGKGFSTYAEAWAHYQKNKS